MATNTANIGHRGRLRKKVLESGIDALHDYEVIELLLTLGTPRSDCKLQAKELINKYGDIRNIIDTDSESLQTVKGVGPNNIFGITLFKEFVRKYQELAIEKKDIFNSPNKVYLYLKEKIGRHKKEKFIVLFFNTKNKLVADEVSTGTLNASLAHPRELFESAIKNHASHIIIAHNHPSGDHTPSNEDIQTTKRLVEAGRILGIEIVDHIVVGEDSYTSIKTSHQEIFTNN